MALKRKEATHAETLSAETITRAETQRRGGKQVRTKSKRPGENWQKRLEKDFFNLPQRLCASARDDSAVSASSPPEVRYSIRSALMGEIEAARLAGIMVAKNAQRASALAARVSANGSQLVTP